VNVVDSSGWIEYLTNGAEADFFAAAILDERELVVPTLSIFEVYRKVLQSREENDALAVVPLMSRGTIVDLTPDLAVAGAELSVQHKLLMADSIILATARAWRATLWTQDADFEGLEGVRYRRKRS
jgi:predicted nucleic acid-binding protein